MPNAQPLATPGMFFSIWYACDIWQLAGSQVSDFVAVGGPRLDALDKEIVDIQTRLQDILERLNTLQTKMPPGFQIYASNMAKEMEDVQVGYQLHYRILM